MKDSKNVRSLNASKMAVHPGGSGKMHNFQGTGTQKAGGSAVSNSGSTGKFAKGGSGKMHKFSGVKPQKAGKTSVS